MIFLLEANSLVHQMYHWAASRVRSETGDMEAQPDPADVLDRFLIRLDNLRDYVGSKTWGLGSRLVCVFDSTAKTFRKDLVVEYKAQRTRIAGVYECVSDAKQAVKSSDEWLAMVSPDGLEADDLIASIAHQSDCPVVIHSSDKDFNQCLEHGRVGIIKRSGMIDTEPNANGIPLGSELVAQHYTAETFDDEFRFPVDRWIDFQCMAGDSADNIKGCPGVGPKAAGRILRDFPEIPLESLSFAQLCTEKYLNKRQANEWPAFLESLPVLRMVFALRVNIPFSLGEKSYV